MTSAIRDPALYSYMLRLSSKSELNLAPQDSSRERGFEAKYWAVVAIKDILSLAT